LLTDLTHCCMFAALSSEAVSSSSNIWIVKTTSSAVNATPSDQVTPSRSFRVHRSCVALGVNSVPSQGWIAPVS